ncbi:ArsA family ATPase [soil metagenome]
MLAERGVMDIAAEELSVPPGMDELFSLLQIKRHHESGEYDVVIVDCAPTGETLRLLSFPEIAKWWLEKVFPVEGRLVAAARPLARTFLDLELPGPEVFDEVQRLVRNLIAMNEILRDRSRASIRLVMNPDRMVIDEAQRTFTYLNLYGYLTDAVIVNRVFPPEVEGGYFGAWRERQSQRLVEVEQGFAPVPVLKARYFDEEVVGTAMLDRLGEELFPDCDPSSIMYEELVRELDEDADGKVTLSIRVPFADREKVSLKRVGSELVIAAGREKRTIILPPALARRRPSGARLKAGTLEIEFENDRPEPHEPNEAKRSSAGLEPAERT